MLLNCEPATCHRDPALAGLGFRRDFPNDRIGPSSILRLVAVTVPLLIAAVGAEPLGSITNPRTRDGTWVTDMPGALRAETVARLNSTISDLERTTSAEMAVVVIGSLDGLSVEEAAVKLFELWGIGKKRQDNGLLLLWSTGDRRVRVEVGYGLEGALPDGKVGAILDTYLIPKFKAGEFDQGLIDGVDALARVARAEPIELVSPNSESYRRRFLGNRHGVGRHRWRHGCRDWNGDRIPALAAISTPTVPDVPDGDDSSRRNRRRCAACRGTAGRGANRQRGL